MKKIGIGQSTIEYVIVFAIVVGAIIVVASMLKPKVQSAYSHVSNAIKNEVQ
jgi:Flp pilus assembly pilin Flp